MGSYKAVPALGYCTLSPHIHLFFFPDNSLRVGVNGICDTFSSLCSTRSIFPLFITSSVRFLHVILLPCSLLTPFSYLLVFQNSQPRSVLFLPPFSLTNPATHFFTCTRLYFGRVYFPAQCFFHHS